MLTYQSRKVSHTKGVDEEVEEERKKEVVCEVKGFITHFTDR